MDAAALHTPVMAERCLELLAPAAESASVIVDATLGMGGHTEAMLTAWPEATVVGIDRDPQAIAIASQRLAEHGSRFQAHHARYDDIAGALAAAQRDRADGILMDLGVSSLQIDDVDRGFTYAQDADLDMRMDPGDPVSAADLLARESHASLTKILREFGEERWAARIATGIVSARDTAPITRSAQLVDIVRAAIPAAARPRGNPAKRTFQALRIAVNHELDILDRALTAAIESLAVGGRMVVLSYHSLEDRMVKRAFAAGALESAPVGLPVVPVDDEPYLKSLTHGAEQASPHEVEANPRAKSVRLRAVQRIKLTPAHRVRRPA